MKIRIKELAQEAKFIRLEENKIKSKQKIQPSHLRWHSESKHWTYSDDKNSSDFYNLQVHRKTAVRNASRESQLAYGFLRDVPYEKIEPTSKPMSIYDRPRLVKEVKRLAAQFGHKNFDDEVEIWMKNLLTI